MKFPKLVVAAVAVVLLLAGCEAPFDPVKVMKEEAKLAEVCHEAGGDYVYALWPGYTSASYKCIWEGKTEW